MKQIGSISNKTFTELKDHLESAEFIVFVTLSLAAVAVILGVYAEQYGKTNMFVYIGTFTRERAFSRKLKVKCGLKLTLGRREGE